MPSIPLDILVHLSVGVPTSAQLTTGCFAGGSYAAEGPPMTFV